MNTYRILVTYADGSISEHAYDPSHKMTALTEVLAASSAIVGAAEICSIDFLMPEETPELAKVRKSKRRPSRADRYSAAQGQVSNGRAEFEELRDELQNWRDAMPEGLQESQKAYDIDDAISELEDCINSCEEIEGKDVSFPGMFG